MVCCRLGLWGEQWGWELGAQEHPPAVLFADYGCDGDEDDGY